MDAHARRHLARRWRVAGGFWRGMPLAGETGTGTGTGTATSSGKGTDVLVVAVVAAAVAVVATAVAAATAAASGPKRAMAAAPANVRAALATARATFVPGLTSAGMHKGQAGRVGVVGGSYEYTGAPFYAAVSSLKAGGDLAFVFCADPNAATPIKTYSPELIVFPSLADASGAKLERLSAVVIGPGLGRAEETLAAVKRIVRDASERRTPIVLDGDALWMLKDNPAVAREAVSRGAIVAVTPNKAEFDRLAEASAAASRTKDEDAQTKLVSQWLGGALVVRKGAADIITNAQMSTPLRVEGMGSPRRCGGQGDVLAGTLGLFLGWVKDHPEHASTAAVSAAALVRHASALAFAVHGRSTTTPDIIAQLGRAFAELVDSAPEVTTEERAKM